MRLRGILQRIGVVDRHVELAVDDGGEQRVGAFEQFLAGRDVVVKLRPGRKQRAVVVEFGERKRRYQAGGVTKAHEQFGEPLTRPVSSWLLNQYRCL
jgi:hypothetical protein